MRWIVVLLALLGLLASVAALREHYRTGASPCSINDKWDCGIVNHSPYAVVGGLWRHVRQKLSRGVVEFKPFTGVERLPVAAIGIAGYLLLGIFALTRAWRTAFFASIIGLGFSLYLTYIEAHDLQIWCIYCVISLVMISLITLSNLMIAIRSGGRTAL
jgi:vitamin-K-epoxide reductase (warfarin-sensitive)